MRRLLFLLLVMSTTLKTDAQKVRFTDTSNEWTEYTVGDNYTFPHIERYSYLRDTLVNGFNYRKLKDRFELIREDSVAQKVYVKYYDNDSNERLLYDYNLNVGDSFRNVLGTHVVSSMASVVIRSVVHKIWAMTEVGGTWNYSVIEGIGSTRGPLFSAYPNLFEKNQELTCFTTGGNVPIINPKVDQFDNATSCLLSVSATMNTLHPPPSSPTQPMKLLSFG